MKAEHRKELQTNLLADRLGRMLQGFRGGFKVRPSHTALLIWGGIIAAIVLGMGWKVYSNSVAKSRSAEWLRIDEASNFDDLKQIAEKDTGNSATRVVRFQLARVYLRRGMENFCSTSPDGRTSALKDLGEAAKLYGDLAGQSKDNAMLTQEALLGVGKAREALNELDAAQTAYEELVKRYPNSVNGKEAAERLKKLENKDQVSAFYKKLDELASPTPVPRPPKKD
jgi:hypothetical protein